MKKFVRKFKYRAEIRAHDLPMKTSNPYLHTVTLVLRSLHISTSPPQLT